MRSPNPFVLVGVASILVVLASVLFGSVAQGQAGATPTPTLLPAAQTATTAAYLTAAAAELQTAVILQTDAAATARTSTPTTTPTGSATPTVTPTGTATNCIDMPGNQFVMRDNVAFRSTGFVSFDPTKRWWFTTIGYTAPGHLGIRNSLVSENSGLFFAYQAPHIENFPPEWIEFEYHPEYPTRSWDAGEGYPNSNWVVRACPFNPIPLTTTATAATATAQAVGSASATAATQTAGAASSATANAPTSTRTRTVTPTPAGNCVYNEVADGDQIVLDLGGGSYMARTESGGIDYYHPGIGWAELPDRFIPLPVGAPISFAGTGETGSSWFLLCLILSPSTATATAYIQPTVPPYGCIVGDVYPSGLFDATLGQRFYTMQRQSGEPFYFTIDQLTKRVPDQPVQMDQRLYEFGANGPATIRICDLLQPSPTSTVTPTPTVTGSPAPATATPLIFPTFPPWPTQAPWPTQPPWPTAAPTPQLGYPTLVPTLGPNDGDPDLGYVITIICQRRPCSDIFLIQDAIRQLIQLLIANQDAPACDSIGTAGPLPPSSSTLVDISMSDVSAGFCAAMQLTSPLRVFTRLVSLIATFYFLARYFIALPRRMGDV